MSAKRVIQGLGLALALVCAALLGKSIYDQVQAQKKPAVDQAVEALTKTSSIGLQAPSEEAPAPAEDTK